MADKNQDEKQRWFHQRGPGLRVDLESEVEHSDVHISGVHVGTLRKVRLDVVAVGSMDADDVRALRDRLTAWLRGPGALKTGYI
jgi:hypothetical protein